MANTVAMRAPVGFTGTVQGSPATPPGTGQSYTPDVNGQVIVDPKDVVYMIGVGFVTSQSPTAQKVATNDNGTTQTLTAAMLSGGDEVFHTSTGGATPSLTLPLATDFIAANPGLAIGQSMRVRIINNNSGVATIVTNTGWTLTGTLTITNGLWREFVVTRTAAATLSGVSVGLGTTS